MRALAAMLIALPCAAWAGWTAGPQMGAGTPLDVQAYDGGYFTATTGTATGNACGYLWDGTTYVLQDCVDGGAWVGAAFNTPTCVVALDGVGKVHYGPGCGGLAPFLPPPPNGNAISIGYRLHGARVGAEFIAVRDNSGGYYVEGATDAGAFTAGLNLLGGGAPANQAFSTLSWNGDDWVLYSLGTNAVLNHLAGGSSGTRQAVTLPSGAPKDLALFDNGASLGAFGVDSTGAQLWRSLSVTATALAALDAGAVGIDAGVAMTSVDYVQTQGSAYGLGFGMLGSGSTVLGAVPDPSNPGGVWVGRTFQPALGSATVVKVSCADPSFCVLLDSSGQVWIYDNTGKPSVTDNSGGYLFVPAGSTGQTLSYTVIDFDGDPTWSTYDAGPGLASFSAASGATTATFDVPNCPGTALVTLTASDGLGAHDSTGVTTIAWDLPAPNISMTSLQLRAGTGPVTLTATQATCAQQNTWFIDGGGYLPDIDGGASSVVITPPANACMVSTSTVTLTQPAVDGGVRSAQVQVEIDPYGPPYTPAFDAGAPTMIDGGLYYFYSAGPIHACANAEAFVSLAGLQVNNPLAGLGLTVDAGIDGVAIFVPQLCLAADAGATLTVSYARAIDNQTTTPAPQFQTSDAGSLTLDPSLLQPMPSPTTSATTFTFTADAGPSSDGGPWIASGDVSAISGSCALLRDYRADISIVSDSGISVADGGFDAPGSWELEVSSQCSGDFIATATLTDRVFGGTSATMIQPISINNGAGAVIGALDGTATVSCSGGSGVVTIELDGGCPSQTYEWSVGDKGPPFTLDAGSSRTVAVSFAANLLDELAGHEVFLDVVVHNGKQTANGTDLPLLITPAPFITAQLNPDPVQPNEEEPAGIEVILTNTTTCDVTGIGVREGLAGLTLVPDSVRVDGRKIPSSVQGGILFVDGLALAGKQTMHLTYQARVPLLGHANPRTTVVMVRPNLGLSCPLTSGGACAFDVTLPTSPGATPRQCGCDAAPDALVLLLTLAGLLFRRRNR